MTAAPDPVAAAEEVHRRLDALDPPVRDRTLRLLLAGLRGRPDLLARWSVRFDWAGTAFRDPDQTLVSLLYDAEEGHVRQLLWHIPEDGTPPEDRAAAALRRLDEEDPRTYGSERRSTVRVIPGRG
ncbi:hypothetical protein ACLQ2N_34650 [Streptomyces sp. DT224]|uniref:hypothetical protein n=1 Tax=Streptomyces sp. DT224 TaxID=3393426 RepID=UPI003CF2B2A8